MQDFIMMRMKVVYNVLQDVQLARMPLHVQDVPCQDILLKAINVYLNVVMESLFLVLNNVMMIMKVMEMVVLLNVKFNLIGDVMEFHQYVLG